MFVYMKINRPVSPQKSIFFTESQGLKTDSKLTRSHRKRKYLHVRLFSSYRNIDLFFYFCDSFKLDNQARLKNFSDNYLEKHRKTKMVLYCTLKNQRKISTKTDHTSGIYSNSSKSIIIIFL